MAEVGVSQDQFICPVCLDLLKDPVAIPCGHSYCMSCITDCWNQEDEKGVYSCPQCRQTFNPRPALNKNTILAGLVEQLQKTKLQASVPAGLGDVECDVCSGRKQKALKSCLVCLNSYCQNHLQQHENFFKGKRHNLIDATGRLEEMICPKHNKALEIFCHTDEECICYLCMMDDHKNHDTVAAVAERTTKQVVLEERRIKFQQRIHLREKHLEELRQAVESHKLSAQKTVQNSERIFNELILFIKKRRSEVTQLIRNQEEAAVSRPEGFMKELELEINDLKRKDAELEHLSHTDDHICFLKSFQSLSEPPESTDVPNFTVSSLQSFDGIGRSVFQMKEKLEGFCREELDKMSGRGAPSQTKKAHNDGEKKRSDDEAPDSNEVKVHPGEEDEEILFRERTKLYRWDDQLNQWKERGFGNIKIFFHPLKKRYHVLMRHEQSLEVCANHSISRGIQLTPMNTSANSLTWKAIDCSDGAGKTEQLAVKFRTADQMKSFKQVFMDCQSHVLLLETLSRDSNPVVFFSMSVDGENAGRIIMELFAHIVPKTAENFRALCTGEKGLGYKGSIFHRIVPDFMCKGGDITHQNGSGGRSIYGDYFEDESFEVRHTGPGMLAMANRGKDTNSSQFFLTLKKSEHLNFIHVAFGFVREGMKVLRRIGEMGSKEGKPTHRVVIQDCGQL